MYSKQFQNSKFSNPWWHRRPACAVNDAFSLPPARRRCHYFGVLKLLLNARYALSASSAVQETAKPHPNPSVQIFVERSATAVLEVCEPAAERPVQFRDDRRQRDPRRPFRFRSHRIFQLPDALLPRPVFLALEVIARKSQSPGSCMIFARRSQHGTLEHRHTHCGKERDDERNDLKCFDPCRDLCTRLFRSTGLAADDR